MAHPAPLIDWVEDVCRLFYFMAASYENKIYSVGGRIETQDSSNSTLISNITDSYLRIVDFSKPLDSSKNNIDIGIDSITTAIRLPDNIPRLELGNLFISDGVVRMLPGSYPGDKIVDENGNFLNTTTYQTNLTNRVWNFDIESQKWGVDVAGTEGLINNAASAFDTERQEGWYYGGGLVRGAFYNVSEVASNQDTERMLLDLYRLNRGKGTPIKVETVSSFIGPVLGGELVFIGGAGETGVLVLIGGIELAEPKQTRSMQTVHVFDIATKTWFAQSTTARQGFYPSGRFRFCSVVASAVDNSSHNIYIFGGWDQADALLSGVFILTLPAFQWVQVYSESPDDLQRTTSHKCVKIYEKHMVSYRGYSGTCDGKIKSQGMMIFDMSSLTWTTKVELENQKYLVPKVLYDIIGGNATGNATMSKPDGGFLDPQLAEVFASKLTTSAPVPTTPVTLPTTAPSGDHSPSRPPVGAIAGGIIGGFVLALVLATCLLLRRRRRRRRRMSQPPGILEYTPELSCTTIKPQELQANGLFELHT